MKMKIEKKKFLIFVDHLRGGGAEIMTVRLAEALIEKGHNVTFAIIDGEKSRIDFSESINIINLANILDWSALSFYKPKIKEISAVNKIEMLVEDVKPDVIILNWWTPHILGNYIKHERMWSWIHGRLFYTPKKRSGLNGLLKWVKDYASLYFKAYALFSNKKIIFLDEKFSKEFPFCAIKARYLTIKNGFPGSFETKRFNKIYDVIYVGRLSSEKQPTHALIAFAKSGLKGRMAFVGDGYLLNELKSIAEKYRIMDRIDFLGWKSNPQDYILSSHSTILSSSTEGLPLVILESLFCRVPVISYNSSPAIESLFRKINADKYLVEINNIQALSAGLRNLLINPYKIEHHMLVDYEISSMAEKFIELAN